MSPIYIIQNYKFMKTLYISQIPVYLFSHFPFHLPLAYLTNILRQIYKTLDVTEIKPSRHLGRITPGYLS